MEIFLGNDVEKKNGRSLGCLANQTFDWPKNISLSYSWTKKSLRWVVLKYLSLSFNDNSSFSLQCDR